MLPNMGDILVPYITDKLSKEKTNIPEGRIIHGIANALNGLFQGQIVHASSPTRTVQ